MNDQINNKVADFFQKGKIQEFRKGEILIRADENPLGIFFLKEGLVKEYAISKKGEELIINIFKPETFFPMSWVLIDANKKYYFEAIENSKVYRLDKNSVDQFMNQNPDVLRDLLQRLYIGIEGLTSRMIYLMSENAYDRLIVELIIHAKRFGTIAKNQTITVGTSEKDLAAKSGLTRETISREMRKLKDRKLISFNKNILTIPNILNLEKELLLD